MLMEIARHLRKAKRILFITGAGMSADSGLPTYRGIGGLYNSELTEDNIPIETALSGWMMANHPEITWKYLLQIEQACRAAKFNQGHHIIRQIEQQKPHTWVLTQNIDGFHRDAGSKNLIEVHGRLHSLQCIECHYAEEVVDFSHVNRLPPLCPQCQGVMRPEVVLFGEVLYHHVIEQLYYQLELGFDAVVSIGTSSVFPYITQPLKLAKQNRKPTIEINPSFTNVSDLVDYKIEAGAAETLTKLWELMNKA
jgi:NAD-dependent deacetylase